MGNINGRSIQFLSLAFVCGYAAIQVFLITIHVKYGALWRHQRFALFIDDNIKRLGVRVIFRFFKVEPFAA